MKPRPSPNRTPRLMQLLTHWAAAPLLLAVIVFVVYANSLQGEFVFDDRAVVFNNPELLNLKTFGEIFRFTDWRQPLYVTYRLNYYIGGLDPFGYHLLSTTLHALNSVVVFYILLEVGASRWAALGGSAFFAVHPLFSSSVSYVAGRSSLLCGTFYFLAILSFLKGVGPSRLWRRTLCLGIVIGAAWLAWSTKEEAITLPLFLAAYLWIRSDAGKWRYFALLSAIPVAVVFAFRRELTQLFAVVSRNQDLVQAGYEPVLAYPAYVRTYLTAVVERIFPKIIWPAGLNVDPVVREVVSWYSPEFLLALCVISALAAAVLLLKGKDLFLLRVGLAGIMVSPLAAYAAIPLADVLQEHRIYIAGLGVALVSAWLVQWSYSRFGPRAVAAFGIAVVALGLATMDRNRVWADDITLWQDAVEKSPAKPRPHMNLGQAYSRIDRLADAQKEYEIALRLNPRLTFANSNLGLIYLQRGDRDSIERARQIFERLRQTAPAFADGWSHLGTVYIRLGQPDQALEVLNQALALRPNSDSALLARGDAYSLKGQYEQAIADYKAALSRRPDLALFHLKLGVAYMKAGNPQSAEQEFRSVTADAKFGAAANRNLGLLRSDAGDDDGAVAYFQAALARQPNFPEVYHDLGLVFLHKGLPDRAIEEFRAALVQSPDFALAVVALSQAYEKSGRPDLARQVLDDDIQRFPGHDSPYLREILHRLNALR